MRKFFKISSLLLAWLFVSEQIAWVNPAAHALAPRSDLKPIAKALAEHNGKRKQHIVDDFEGGQDFEYLRWVIKWQWAAGCYGVVLDPEGKTPPGTLLSGHEIDKLVKFTERTIAQCVASELRQGIRQGLRLVAIQKLPRPWHQGTTAYFNLELLTALADHPNEQEAMGHFAVWLEHQYKEFKQDPRRRSAEVFLASVIKKPSESQEQLKKNIQIEAEKLDNMLHRLQQKGISNVPLIGRISPDIVLANCDRALCWDPQWIFALQKRKEILFSLKRFENALSAAASLLTAQVERGAPVEDLKKTLVSIRTLFVALQKTEKVSQTEKYISRPPRTSEDLAACLHSLAIKPYIPVREIYGPGNFVPDSIPDALCLPRKDPITGFVYGGINDNSLIAGLTQINNIPIDFLQHHSDHVHMGFLEKLMTDNEFVRSRGLTHQELAFPILYVCPPAARRWRGLVDMSFEYNGQWFDVQPNGPNGVVYSRFGDGVNASAGNAGIIRNRQTGQELQYNQRTAIYIWIYGFYQDYEPFKMDPKDIIKMFYPERLALGTGTKLGSSGAQSLDLMDPGPIAVSL